MKKRVRNVSFFLFVFAVFLLSISFVSALNTLNVYKAGAGLGTITSNDVPQTINCGVTCSASYIPGAQVTLTATPTSGSRSRFGGWSGACSGKGTCTITMSSQQSVTATFNLLPLAPSGLTATTFSSSQINLRWTDNSDNEKGFKIERAFLSLGPWTRIATVGANVISYADKGLFQDTTYYYRVRAYNIAGNSGYSTQATATTGFTFPTFGVPSSQGIFDDTIESTYERSGIAPSWKNPGVLWLERDGDNPNYIYAINTKGQLLAKYMGGVNNDWEDLAVGPGPVPGEYYIYIPNFGNWGASNHQVVLYRAIEPSDVPDPNNPPSNPSLETLSEVVSFTFNNPNGYNFETMMIEPTTGDVFMIPRGSAGGSGTTRPVLYFHDIRTAIPGETYNLETIGTITGLDPYRTVTGGDISRDGRLIAILQHERIRVWVIRNGQIAKDVLKGQAPISLRGPIDPIRESMGEAVAFSREVNGIFAVNEQHDAHLWFFPRTDISSLTTSKSFITTIIGMVIDEDGRLTENGKMIFSIIAVLLLLAAAWLFLKKSKKSKPRKR